MYLRSFFVDTSKSISSYPKAIHYPPTQFNVLAFCNIGPTLGSWRWTKNLGNLISQTCLLSRLHLGLKLVVCARPNASAQSKRDQGAVGHGFKVSNHCSHSNKSSVIRNHTETEPAGVLDHIIVMQNRAHWVLGISLPFTSSTDQNQRPNLKGELPS